MNSVCFLGPLGHFYLPNSLIFPGGWTVALFLQSTAIWEMGVRALDDPILKAYSSLQEAGRSEFGRCNLCCTVCTGKTSIFSEPQFWLNMAAAVMNFKHQIASIRPNFLWSSVSECSEHWSCRWQILHWHQTSFELSEVTTGYTFCFLKYSHYSHAPFRF